MTKTDGRKWFAMFAWSLLAFNIPVILWGAYVRVSFSGDGCGAHWPFCAGQVIPQHMAAPMAIEFTHRMMTSVDSIGTILLCVWAFRCFPRAHGVRRYAVLSLIFLFIEALLGAGLVLFRYVAHDQSAGRAIYLSAHLTNTMLLLAAFTTTAWLAVAGISSAPWGRLAGKFQAALAASVVVAITGAIAALGDTLFPSASLAAGLQQDFSNASSTLLRLRLFHPILAVAGAAVLLWAATSLLKREENSPSRKAGIRVIVLVLAQILAGVVNITLLAPVAMQMIHLFIADVLWIAVVVMALEAASVRVEGETSHSTMTGIHGALQTK
ncbi:MAG: COX15/CtaA family protein [Bryobacteraceae bacterium]